MLDRKHSRGRAPNQGLMSEEQSNTKKGRKGNSRRRKNTKGGEPESATGSKGASSLEFGSELLTLPDNLDNLSDNDDNDMIITTKGNDLSRDTRFSSSKEVPSFHTKSRGGTMGRDTSMGFDDTHGHFMHDEDDEGD